MVSLEQVVWKLPLKMQEEVKDFAEFLLQKTDTKKSRKLSLDWAGSLKEFRDQFTSEELQKKSLDWWGN